MGVLINAQNVDERYSNILEPNLFYDSIFVPGVTCTDQYQEGPAGGIYVHKLKTSAVTPGKPGRDFTDEETSDDLIQILLNNNFQKSKKIYNVQAAQVGIALGNENLSLAIQECSEGRQISGIACLINEGTAATATTAVDNPKADAVDTRAELVKAKGAANVVLCSPDYYAKILKIGRFRVHPEHQRADYLDRPRGSVVGHDLHRVPPHWPRPRAPTTTTPAPSRPWTSPKLTTSCTTSRLCPSSTASRLPACAMPRTSSAPRRRSR